jgi:hypothetical protein
MIYRPARVLLVGAVWLLLGMTCCARVALANGGSTQPMLTVEPVPTVTHRAVGTPQVKWATGNGDPGEVTVASPHMREVLFANGEEGSNPAPWLSGGQIFIFRLYAVGGVHRLLARLTVGRGEKLDVIAPAPAPPATSAAINRALELLPFAWLAMFAVLGGLYWRDIRRRA